MEKRQQRTGRSMTDINLQKDQTSHSTDMKKMEALLAVVIQINMETITWAVSSREDYLIDESRIKCRMWMSGSSPSECAPLSVLISPDGKEILGFGYDAQRLYENLKATNEHGRFYFFERVALKLVKAFTENDDLQLQDENGKKLKAINVFKLALDFLKRDLLKRLRPYLESDMSYVLIVPEMFQVVGAVDFIRKAALEAGINVKMLSVLTEIDAMAVFHQQKSQKSTSRKTSIEGKKFLIVNAGGYSTSIVVHESTVVGVVKESTPLETRQGGIRMLKKSFSEFCSDVFEKDAYITYKSKSKQEWSQMKIDFLLKAFTFEPSQSSTNRFKITSELHDSLKRGTSSRKGSKSKYLDSIYCSADKICVPSEILESIIEPSVHQVIEDIRNATSKETDMEEIVLFGEFMKLPMLRHGIFKEFSDKSVTFYEGDTHSTLKGAVIIGLGLGHIEKVDRVHNAAIVAAIDFGTTYSGWSYSLRTDFELDHRKTSTKLWNSGHSLTEKTPTCIVIGQGGKTLEAFGYEAEDRYQELVNTEDHRNYHYFRRFKMALNKKLGEKLNRHMTLEDVMNRSLPALDVFAMSIKYLKDDLLNELHDKYLGNIRKDDIHWVLTVPAIWTDGSKQFMRESAIKAGIKRKRLSIALEPEAASMYCRSLPIEITQCNEGVNISSLSVGKQYMVLDAGGGTIDITVHEIVSKNDVREVHAACGGGWGGITVDEEFKKFLISIVTENVYEKFKVDHTDDWLEIWRDFEVKKRTIITASSPPIRMRLPLSLIDKYAGITGRKLTDDLKRSKDIQLVRDKINISSQLAKSWFTGSVDKTVHMIKGIMSKNPNISAILMVGGFSESKVLQNAIRSAFNGVDVIIPTEASTCILKGALIFGHLPKVVTERVLKYTYGIESFENFLPEKHPPKKLITTDRGFVCQNIFSKHAEVDQRVKVGEPQVWHAYSPQYKTQKQMSFSVYASERPNPKYTDVDCTQIGKLLIDLDDHDESLDREILVAFTFSGTEIVVEAKDTKTGNHSFVAIDFLG